MIQGSVLGPALFIVFINDIVQCFPSGNPFLFANDCKIVFIFHPRDILEKLRAIREALSRLEEWCQRWQMLFNPDKCHILALRCTLLDVVFTLHGAPLSITSSVRDLGLYYSSSLNFSEHILHQVARARRLSFLLLRHFSTNSSRITLYKACVRPILEYACFSLSFARDCDLHLIESVQRRFTAKLVGVPSMSYKDRCNNLSLDPLWFRRLKLGLATIFRLFNSPESDHPWFSSFHHDPIYTLRNNSRNLHPPCARSSLRSHFFVHRLTPLWNALPHVVKHSPSTRTFYTSLDSFLSIPLAASTLYHHVSMETLFTNGLPSI